MTDNCTQTSCSPATRHGKDSDCTFYSEYPIHIYFKETLINLILRKLPITYQTINNNIENYALSMTWNKVDM